MALSTAFWLAVSTGAIAGAAVVRIRSMAHRDDFSMFQGAMLGGLGAAAIFGGVFAMNAVLYFLLGSSSPAAMLGFTVFAVLLFALVFLI